MFFQLAYSDRRGYHQEQSSDGRRLAEKLTMLKCEAELWILNGQGKRFEKIGSVEASDGRCDDKRVKWLWFYDREAVEQ